MKSTQPGYPAYAVKNDFVKNSSDEADKASISRLSHELNEYEDLTTIISNRIDKLGMSLFPVRNQEGSENPCGGDSGVESNYRYSPTSLRLRELNARLRSLVGSIDEIQASIDA